MLPAVAMLFCLDRWESLNEQLPQWSSLELSNSFELQNQTYSTVLNILFRCNCYSPACKFIPTTTNMACFFRRPLSAPRTTGWIRVGRGEGHVTWLKVWVRNVPAQGQISAVKARKRGGCSMVDKTWDDEGLHESFANLDGEKKARSYRT